MDEKRSLSAFLRVGRHLLPLVVLVLCGCVVSSEESQTLAEGVFLFDDEGTSCDQPADWVPELREEAASRGVELLNSSGRGAGDDPPGSVPSFGSGLANVAFVAQDVDADGHIDIVANESPPVVYRNDGTGHFDVQTLDYEADQGGYIGQLMAADLDGDSLPELIGSFRPDDPSAEHQVVVWPNEGDAVFGIPRAVSTGHAGPYGESSTMAIGDINGDGWLDLHHAKRTQVPGLMGTHPEQVFLGGPDGFRADAILELSAYSDAAGVVTLVSVFTDRDGDGDQDLFVLGGTPEWGWPPPGNAFFRNDGGPEGDPLLVNDAVDTGTDEFFSAMGIDSADLNGDGILDYCATDVGPPRCFLSLDSGGWYEGAVSELGLVPDEPIYETAPTIGWSIDFRDLNNDGWLDVLHASGPDHGGIWSGDLPFPDLLWIGREDGTFADMTDETGFGGTQNHVGMVSADFDSNGAMDVLFHAESVVDKPQLFMNGCTEGNWTNIELVGPRENSEGFGARLEFDFGGRTQIRELFGLRATVQGPSRVHQGLGEEAAFDLVVRWPDGAVTRSEGLPSNRLVTAVHPQADSLPE